MRGFVVALVLVLVASTADAQTAPPTEPTRRGTVAVLPIAAEGLDPVVPQRFESMLVRVLASLGYDPVPAASVERALAAVRASTPPLPSDIWRVTVLAGAERGVHVTLGTEGERYVAELFVASADGSGPFRTRVVGAPAEFLASSAAALRALVPTPASFDPAAAQRYSVGFGTASGATSSPAWSSIAPMRPTTPRPRERVPRYGVSLVSESAFGSSQAGRFYNHLVGTRVDLALNDNIVLGAFAGYVNLDRGNDRVSNVLGFLQLEDRLRFYSTGRARFPLRVGFGYLPKNGPFLRFSAGIRFPAGDRFEIGLDLLAPTFWWAPGDRFVTYDLGVELTHRFGPSR